jgi:transcriptional regulator with XRE-family HTH domain
MKYQKRLKDIREDHDLTQEDLAKILQTSQQYYGKYENGKYELPFSRAIELAKFYNISLDYIAGLIDEPKTIQGTAKNITNIKNNAGSITINNK